jgi:hypothetical protein
MHVLRKVKKAAVDAQYGIYYYLLTDGCAASDDGKTKGMNILADSKDGTTPNHQYIFKPNIPKNLVNEFAMKASATIDKIAEEALNMILPDDWKTIADQRLYSKTKGTIGFD